MSAFQLKTPEGPFFSRILISQVPSSSPSLCAQGWGRKEDQGEGGALCMGAHRTELKEHPPYRGMGGRFCKSQMSGWRQHREMHAPEDSQKSGLEAGFPTGHGSEAIFPGWVRAGLHVTAEECSLSSLEA